MSRSNLTIVAVVVIIIGVVAAAALAYSFLKPTEEASAPIEAVPISQTESESDDGESQDTPADSSSGSEEVAQEVSSSSESEDSESEGSDSPETTSDPEPAAEGGEEPTDEQPAGGEAILFNISQDESEARFYIDEDLRGERVTVVGVTDQVAGEIQFEPTDLSKAQVGTILVNARTIQTDNDNRNRALGNRILETGSYEIITFEPTAISGLPETVSAGETVSFQITGSLTVRDITKEVTFDAEVTFVSEDTLEGLANAADL